VLSKYIDIVSISVNPQSNDKFSLDFVDTEAGIKNMFGDTQLYLEILYTFYVDYANHQKAFDTMFKDEDEDDLIIEVHTIKGLAATIGATELHKIATDFEMKLREKDFDFDTYKKFADSFRILIGNLRRYFKANPFRK